MNGWFRENIDNIRILIYNEGPILREDVGHTHFDAFRSKGIGKHNGIDTSNGIEMAGPICDIISDMDRQNVIIPDKMNIAVGILGN